MDHASFIKTEKSAPLAMLLKYQYLHTKTLGTTGYAECTPEIAQTLAEHITMLAQRPLDTFLHRHVLKEISNLQSDQLADLACSALADGSMALAALLRELVLINPEAAKSLAPWLDRLVDISSNLAEATPLRLLASVKNESNPPRWTGVFDANIRSHKPVAPIAGPQPFSSESVRECKRQMDACDGKLAAAYASLAPGWQVLVGMAPDLKAIYARALQVLTDANILAGPEMRHEASLCPIALLRSWRIVAGTSHGRTAHSLTGTATAYGKGLTLAQARVSCIMEIVERASAHAVAQPGGSAGVISGCELEVDSWSRLKAKGRLALEPARIGAMPGSEGLPLHWITGSDALAGEILVPAQAAYLFCNLDEVELFENIGSTGLAAGITHAGAKLAALCEALERDAHATVPFRPEDCFELESRNPIIQDLLADYRWRGIHVQFQDITGELGVPAYRCFVQGLDGEIAQATGAGLSGPRAAIAALTETPWPYVWANPMPAPTGRGLPNLPLRILEDLPDYSLPTDEASLTLLQNALLACGYCPVYINLTRQDLGFPVYRALIPGLQTDCEMEQGPSLRLWTRYAINQTP